MAKLSKRAASLIGLGVALVVLAGAYVLIQVLPGGAQETPSPAAEEIVLYESDEADVAGFTLENAAGSYAVIVGRQQETMTTYTIEGYPDVPVNEANARDVLTNVSKIPAVSVVEEETPGDLIPYGLDPAAATATIDFTDGSSEVFYVGNKTGAGNTYYMMKQDDPAVYEVKLLYADRFSYTLEDMVKTDVLPMINTVALERMVLKRAGQPDIETAAYVTPEGQPHIGVSGFKVISPFSRPRDIDAEALDAFLQNVSAIEISGVASLDGDELDRYGLAEPRIELLEKDADNTLHVYFGDDIGENAVACMVEGYTPVYTVDTDSISFLEELKASELADKFLLLPMIDDVEGIDVSIGGHDYAMTIERRTEEAENEDEEDEIIETFFLDGVQRDEEVFRDAYSAVIGVRADTYADDPALTEGDPVASVTYHFTAGDPLTVSYYPYDTDFYAGAVDGETQALVAKRKVDAIAGAIEDLQESEYVEE